MLLTEPVRGELAPTASHDRREYRWEPADRCVFDEHYDGTLRITLTHTGKRRVRTELFTYFVSVEWEYALEYGLRSFLIESYTEPDADGPFRCVVGGVTETCGCEHGRIAARRGESAECKHAAACRDLCERGVV